MDNDYWHNRFNELSKHYTDALNQLEEARDNISIYRSILTGMGYDGEVPPII